MSQHAHSPRAMLLATLGLASVQHAIEANAPVTNMAATPVLAGGATTVFDDTASAYSHPAPNLDDERRTAFFVGNSFFKHNWVIAPSSTQARDGLGPLFNARSCSSCHSKDGRGQPPRAGEPMSTMLLRISVPGATESGAPLPDPIYGDQIQGLAIPGVPAEADVLVDYEEFEVELAGGERLKLRRPAYSLSGLRYGPASSELLTSPRVAPAMIGLGLLEAIPEARLREHADPDDRDEDGVSGRLNLVFDQRSRGAAPGRFGWKAEQPTVLQQCAAAFAGDIGITSSIAASENHTVEQLACADAPSGGSPEVSDEILEAVAFYSATLGVPAQRRVDDPNVRRGERLFARARCDACHTPQFTTGELAGFPELSHQTIRPYTDLLLHDMGPELADGRPAFSASGTEWRTAPLWGIGLVEAVSGHTCFLHDGRARNLTEAILWHGGEAAASREEFRAMQADERAALIEFLESL